MSKRGQATWEEYRDIVRGCREVTGKSQTHLEFNLARGAKDNKKGCFKYIKSRRKRKENVGQLLNEAHDLVTKDTEKAELLNAFFASVFTAKTSPLESLTFRTREEICRNEDFPLVEEDQIRDLLGKLDSHKSTEPDGIYS